MPNNQNFLLDMWNETPWMIPVMILMWVGMIAFVRWVIKLDKRRCKSHRETYVVVFMIVAACATGIGTYLLYRGSNLLGAVCAFLFMGGIVGGCVGSVWLDPIGAANGIVVGIGLSAIFLYSKSSLPGVSWPICALYHPILGKVD